MRAAEALRTEQEARWEALTARLREWERATMDHFRDVERERWQTLEHDRGLKR
jgi:hypothetical protein